MLINWKSFRFVLPVFLHFSSILAFLSVLSSNLLGVGLSSNTKFYTVQGGLSMLDKKMPVVAGRHFLPRPSVVEFFVARLSCKNTEAFVWSQWQLKGRCFIIVAKIHLLTPLGRRFFVAYFLLRLNNSNLTLHFFPIFYVLMYDKLLMLFLMQL